MAVWVCVPRLPPYYFNKQFLARIGDQIDKMLLVNETTLTFFQGQFAQVSIEVDLSKPLVAKFCFNRRIKKLAYKGLHAVCFSCGMYGHKQESCPSVVKENESSKDESHTKNAADTNYVRREEERP